MKLSELGEFGLINRIAKLATRSPSAAPVGIGDDAAVLKVSAARSLLVTTDALIENVHFDLSFTDFYSLGWKSAAVNLSDIAAMGGIPRFFLTALGLPPKVSAEEVLDFYRGFNALLRKNRALLVGGDTCASFKGLFISVTALGEAEPRWVVTRSGARPGDRIFVTGSLGDSAAGLELLQSGVRSKESGAGIDRSHKRENRRGRGNSSLPTFYSALIKKHLRPVPRISEGREIARSGCASAMIDISDGLSSDLSHICDQSGAGAEILTNRLPASSALGKAAGMLSKPMLHYMMSGGEDYELLFTVPPSRMKKFRSLAIQANEIGVITAGKGIRLIDSKGQMSPLVSSGYDHFRPSANRPIASRKRRSSRRA